MSYFEPPKAAATAGLNVGIAVIGDSISSEGKTERFDWLSKLCFFSDQGYRFARNFAVGGKTTAQIQTEQLPLVLAMNPKPRACVIAAGSNDMASNTTVDAGIVLIKQMAVTLRNAGILPILWTVPPRGNIAGSGPFINRWNAAIHVYRSVRGYPLCDAHAAATTPATDTIDPILTYDGTHPTARGCSNYAQYFLADPMFSGVPKDGASGLVSSDVDSSNLLDKACFTTDDATGVASAFFKFNIPGASIIAGAPKGRWQRITRAAGAVANTGNIVFPQVLGVTVGQKFEISARLVSKQDPAQTLMYGGLIGIIWQDAVDAQIAFEFLAGKPGLADEAGTFIATTVCPAGAVRFQLTSLQSNGATAPTADTYFQFAQFTVRNVSAASLEPASV